MVECEPESLNFFLAGSSSAASNVNVITKQVVETWHRLLDIRVDAYASSRNRQTTMHIIRSWVEQQTKVKFVFSIALFRDQIVDMQRKWVSQPQI